MQDWRSNLFSKICKKTKLKFYFGIGLCEKNFSDGGWSDYSQWSTCTLTCGGGTQSRTRLCNNPTPTGDGKTCNGPSSQTQICNNITCPIGKYYNLSISFNDYLRWLVKTKVNSILYGAHYFVFGNQNKWFFLPEDWITQKTGSKCKQMYFFLKWNTFTFMYLG